jgi:hypothetical protein
LTVEETVNTHSNARFGREVEWNVRGTTTFFPGNRLVRSDPAPTGAPASANRSHDVVALLIEIFGKLDAETLLHGGREAVLGKKRGERLGGRRRMAQYPSLFQYGVF